MTSELIKIVFTIQYIIIIIIKIKQLQEAAFKKKKGTIIMCDKTAL